MAKAKHIHFSLLVLAIVVSDQVTKSLIVKNFLLGEALAIVPGFFNLTYIRNTGVAFGMFARGGDSIRLFLLVVPSAVTVALLVFYLRLSKEDLWRRLAVCFILGGAVSNLFDRFRLGYVVDFLDFHWRGQAHYPSFNLADAFICIGVGVLFLLTRTADKAKSVANV